MVPEIPDDIRAKLVTFFRGDQSKIAAWWETPNSLIGGVSPRFLVANGREAKLRVWVDVQLAEGAVTNPHG